MVRRWLVVAAAAAVAVAAVVALCGPHRHQPARPDATTAASRPPPTTAAGASRYGRRWASHHARPAARHNHATLLQASVDARPPRTIDPLHVLYVGKGHYFRFLEPAIEHAVHPRPVRVGRDDADDDTALAPPYDLVIMSVDTATPADLAVDYGTAAVLGCAAEPRTDTARVAAFAAAAAVRGRPVLVLSTVATHAVLPAVRYYPAWAMSLLGSRHSAGPADLVGRKTPKTITQTMKSKSHFACFMYSHASPARDALFDLLTDRYKAVTPLGAAKQDRRQAWMPAPVLDRRLANATLTFNDAAVDRYRACKFVIAGESTLLDGYTTEKLVNPMLAAAIPIYYGPPSAAHAFNPASYIDAASLSADDLVAEVARLDRNDTAYRLKLAQPWFAGDALPAWVDVGFLAGVVAPVVPGG